MALRIIERKLGQVVETLSECAGTGVVDCRGPHWDALSCRCDACKGTGQDREATKALDDEAQISDRCRFLSWCSWVLISRIQTDANLLEERISE
jgi:hypothetical protein